MLPFLEQSKSTLQDADLRLNSGVRKFDIVTGENWSVYFRVVNTTAHKASPYYIVDLSSQSPLHRRQQLRCGLSSAATGGLG